MILFKQAEQPQFTSGLSAKPSVTFGKAKAFLKTYAQEQAEREAAMRAREIEDAKREAEFWAGRGANIEPIRF